MIRQDPVPASGRDLVGTGALGSIIREIARGGLAGLAAGVLVGGVGGRVAMRISFLLDPEARGALTEAGQRVGVFTLDGTFGLVVFGGLFAGLFGAFLWVVTQRWLPDRPSTRALAGTVVGIGLGARVAVDGDNFDFVFLDPPVLQATLFIVLAALTGAGIVWADRWLDTRLPDASGLALAVYSVMTIMGVGLAVPMMLTFFVKEPCSCRSLPWLPGGFVLATALITLAAWVIHARGVRQPVWMESVGRTFVTGAVISGMVHLAAEIAHFA